MSKRKGTHFRGPTSTNRRITEKDIKLLWGRAAGLCSICRRKLSQDKATAKGAVPLGEQAHIVAEETKGPRGRSLLTLAERNSYFNLILLCPTHHTEIDKIPAKWPIEKLHIAKRQHELWVEIALAGTQDAKKRAADLTYTTLIDTAVDACMFERWTTWTNYALEQPPKWRHDWLYQFDRFGRAVLAAVWPGTKPELERALQTLSTAIEIAVYYFDAHIDREENDWLIGEKFYRREFGRPGLYDLKEQYQRWLQCCARSIFEATRAANWVADVVRRDINPEFFAAKGRFTVTEGPCGLLDTVTFHRPEYTPAERKKQPALIREYLARLRNEDDKREQAFLTGPPPDPISSRRAKPKHGPQRAKRNPRGR